MGKIGTSIPVLQEAMKPTAAVTRARAVDAAGNQITSRGVRAYGIALDDATAADVTAGKSIGIGTMGVYELEVDGAIAAGVRLTVDAQGRGSAAAAGEIVNFISREASAAAGDRIRVKLCENEQSFPSANIVSLTDNSGGTPSDTIADVPAAYNEATLANQIASLTAKINAILAVLDAHDLTL